MATAAASPPPAVQAGGEPLVLADGIELIGEYEGSGYKEPPLLARRRDGQMIQLPRLLYLIAAATDGHRDAEAVAAVVTEHYGKRVGARSVRHLVERKLRPLGVLALGDGTTPDLPKREPVMALRHRRPLIPERAVNVIARGFTWLHRAPMLLLVVLALGALDAWLFGIHGIAGGMRAVLYNPTLLLGVLLSTVVATAFHEIGHASACRFSGARPGAMGVGIYLVWPAFYCDVTDAYRLNRRGRLRTDLGGVYFNGIFALATGIAFFATGQEALLLIVFVQHTIVLQQLLPLLRFDGYYVLSDLTGVPDILSRIGPIFRSFVPGHAREPKVDALKPWVRGVVTTYLLVLIPTLAFMIVSSVIATPRMAATAYDSFGLQLARMRSGEGTSEAALGLFQIGALLLPIGAIAVSVSRTGRMAARGLFRWSSGSVPRRAVAVTAIAAVVGAAAYAWWPNGDYRPIQPGERGTVGQAVSSLPDATRSPLAPAPQSTIVPVATPREQGTTRHHTTAPDTRDTPQAPSATEVPDDGWQDGGTPSPDGSDESPGEFNDPGPTATPSATPSTAPSQPAPAGTATPTQTPTPTATETQTPTPTATATPSSTATTTPSATATTTPSTTSTPSLTPSSTPTSTP